MRPHNRLPDESVRKIIALRSEGVPVKDIANEIGCSPTTVTNYAADIENFIEQASIARRQQLLLNWR